MKIRTATTADVHAIVQLLNICYRSNGGWTNEAHLVGGIRTTAAEIEATIQNSHNHFFVITDEQYPNQLLACICVTEKNEKQAYIGTFAVQPNLQNQGIGNRLLSYTEAFASNQLEATQLNMSILTHRPELLAYYQRRGYQLTGKEQEFPIHSNNGEPKVKHLKMLGLAKIVNSTKPTQPD